MNNEYLFLQGELLVAARSGSVMPTQFRQVGNAPAITLALGSGALPQAYSTPPGGQYVSLMSHRDSEELPSISFDLENVTQKNLALALYGTETFYAGGSALQEQVIIQPDMTNYLANMNLTAFSSLTNLAGTLTYKEGIDYFINLRYGSITIPAGSAIGSTMTCRATYTYAAVTGVRTYTTIPDPVWLRFVGVNKVDSKPMIVDLYKVQFLPLDSLPLIDDGAKVITMNGTVHRDYYDAANPELTRLFDIRKG